jgi:hypothetical protein
MNLHLTSKHGTSLSFLAVALLVAASLACNLTAIPAPTPLPDYAMITVAALTMENSRLATQVAGLATADAHQATQIAAQATVNARQATQMAAQGTVISYLATRVGAQPITTVAPIPTMTPYRPVRGAVEIEDGRCCTGGMAGETIQVNVAFEATSPLAEVTEMRIRAGGVRFTESEMAEAEWEPFASLKTYPVYVALNWVGFYVSIQYRDAQGNLSPVYHDDISVEGHPPTPSPQPTP